MKCQRCGKDIPDGELFCAHCGAEVQLVPDYNTVDYWIQRQKNEQDQLLKEEERRLSKLKLKEKSHKKKIRPVIIGIMVTIGVAVLLFLIVSLVRFRNANSYEYQMKSAYEAYENAAYTDASEYADRALYLRPGDFDAQILIVDIYMKTGYNDEAAHILKSLILNDGSKAECYEKLISIYEADGDVDRIKAVMDTCTNTEILKTFSDYICENPSFVTLGGTYKSKVHVEILSTGGTVYYTTDGTIPTNYSTLYSGPIQMQEGKTTVMAVAYNEKGIPSDIISRDFTVVLAHPDPPQIVPASGTYDYGSKITVIVPDGCKAYYVFDGVADMNGTLYKEPVTMKSGEHIFSVILIDENGKQSYPASQTYIVE